MNNALLIQQCTSSNGVYGGWTGIFYDMLKLVVPRHIAYARAHEMDYQVNFGDIVPERNPGAWDKIELILQALKRGYKDIVWFDTDAAVMDFSADLRDALPEGASIGCTRHDPDKSQYLKVNQVPLHLNVGVMYVRNDPRTVEFFETWSASYPGPERWYEQGSFNQLSEDKPWVVAVEDKWKATLNVNWIDKPAVKGWHGVMPPQLRLDMMKNELAEDFIKFRP